MQERDLKVGRRVVATRPLGYQNDSKALAAGAVNYVKQGTAGIIVAVQRSTRSSWSLVTINFEGHEQVYCCDIGAALFALRVQTLPAKRPSYREAVQWIAHNDEPGEMDPDVVASTLTVVLVADLFGRAAAVVAGDVVAMREHAAAKAEG